jgi:hypothetical protein
MGGRLRESRAQLLTCVRETCPAFIRADCTSWLAEVEAAQPTVVFAAVDEKGRDLPAATIAVDGAPVPSATDGREHPIDPGPHDLRLDANGRQMRSSIVVRSGEKGRRVELRLPASEPRAPVTSRPVPLASYVAGGVAVALMATGGVLWAFGRASASRYNAQCAAGECTSSDRDGVRRELAIGDVVFGAGLVAAVIATYAYLARPTRVTPATGANGAVAISF